MMSFNKRTNLLEEAESLLEKLNRMQKFTDKYSITPSKEARRLVDSIANLAESIPEIESPQNQEQLIQSELKRRLKGESVNIEHLLSGRPYDFKTITDILAIPDEDILSLRPWLEENKEKTQEAVERLFCSRNIDEYELPLASDIPSVRRQAEEFAGVHIQKYHKTLGKFLQGLTEVGVFLRDINAVPTTQERSYFDCLRNNLALSIPAICFSREDGTLSIRDKELISAYGHEGMGHALNFVITRSGKLPHFLTKNSWQNVSTAESVAQFYENVLIEDLKKSPETQRKLGIEHKFSEIYQEAKDTKQLREYRIRTLEYAIFVLGDKSMGNPEDPEVVRKKTDIICEVAIDKNYVQSLVQQNRHNFDSEGNLNSQLVSELRYCAKPVHRGLEEFAKYGVNYDEKGRSMIDSTFLKGLWTPIGFVENARLSAQDIH